MNHESARPEQGPGKELGEKFFAENVIDQGMGAYNEDALFIAGKRMGVFDGATSLDGWKNGAGETGGFLASRIAKDTAARADEEASPREALLSINERLVETMRQEGVDTSKKSNRWALTSALIQVRERTFQWAQIGDSTLLVLYKNGSHKILGNDTDFDIESLSMWEPLVQQGVKNAFQHPVMREQIIKIREQSNVTYGFLNGEKDAEKFIAHGEEPLQNVLAILLFTDGLTIPKTDPRTPNDLETIKNLYLEKGLRAVQEYVRDLENSDPDCRLYTRFKTHDDIAAIAVRSQE